MKYKISIIVLILVLFPSYLSVSSDIYLTNNINLKDSPISITSDSDFISLGFPGSGTEEDPYIIENYFIEGIQRKGLGINIFGTTKYFIIRNCILKNFERGIVISNCKEGTAKLENNTIINCRELGIYVFNTYGSIIKDNWCEDCELSGIRTENSNGSIFNDNILYRNEEGISIYTSDDNVLTNNTLIKNNRWGIALIWGSKNNSVNYNYFLENVEKQGQNEGTDNNWNNNYWSDWSGVGAYSNFGGTEPVQDSSPLVCQDTDNDKIIDKIENVFHTEINDSDTDNDSLSDYQEILYSFSSPIDSDTDSDGMPDGWEVSFGLDPLTDDSTEDLDGDGLTNLEEYQARTDPTKNDTDGDGFSDYKELKKYGTNPTNKKSNPLKKIMIISTYVIVGIIILSGITLIALLIIKERQKKIIAELSEKWNEEKIRFEAIAEEADEVIKLDQNEYLEELPLVRAKIKEYIQKNKGLLKSIPFTIGKQNSSLLKKIEEDMNNFIPKNINQVKNKLLEKEMEIYFNQCMKLISVLTKESFSQITDYEKEWKEWKEWKKRIKDTLEREMEERTGEEREMINNYNNEAIALSKLLIERKQEQMSHELEKLQKQIIEQTLSTNLLNLIKEINKNSKKISDYNLIFNLEYKSIENKISEEERKRLIEKHQEIEEKIEHLVILPLKLIKDKGRELLEEGEKVYKILLKKQTKESLYRFTEYEKEWKKWKKRSEIILAEEIEIKELKNEKDLIQKEKEELKEIITQNKIKYKEVKRIKEFVEVLSNFSEISLVELQQRLDFAELQELEMWLLDLSSVLSIRIEGNKLIIPEKATREITQSIDELIKRFSEWEKTGEGKKI
ncbi:MAG: right-handed parallel beta-helix repeat-containing protein [Candidatus Heimdallarchaeum endolithica]|uniref:Right-handed parallel beta-helix repeat-containing protein n=1 Tax=Candidatus Heimdallarchaeum endolithica TaxID=2876572 RepID=A0A9Y1BRZ8_9ARCH|nr:MAG: right-handed parallel beta-helix repeat-containing protein [Candidatus Heimdallarchaeum endolithica]